MLAQKSSKKLKKEAEKKKILEQKTSEDMSDAFSAIADIDEEKAEEAQTATPAAAAAPVAEQKEKPAAAQVEKKAAPAEPKKEENDAQPSKFEQEFVDEDDDDESPKKKQSIVQVSTTNMSPEQKLSHSISLVQTNLKAAKSALEKSTTGISDMTKFIKTQKGLAKKQLA
jgi:hypothetical protein